MKSINLHIDQLTLHGFDRIDQQQVGSAVQSELNRLIHEQGLPPSMNQNQMIANMNAGEFKTGQNTGANSVGIQVAQKIYRGIAR
ncbi:MAG: hypothetical protein V3V18_00320 [Methylococcales bacterium]